MYALNSETENLFSIPVALIFQNETSLEEPENLGYNTSSGAAVNVSQSNHSWKKEEVSLSGLQKPEKIGDAIRRELKWAFILHTYGFGCLFFILAFYSFFSILNLRSFISSRPFMTTINGFLCLLGTSRAASLFIDPYSLKENMPKLFGQVLWDLGFPSIISAFCLVQLAFLQFTQLQIGLESLRKKSCLSLIVTAHFLLTIGTDIVVASHENLMVAKHLVHYVFLTWGVFICSNFLYTGYKVMSVIRKIPGGMKFRELPDPSYKGIMQLAMLAPHNNLAGSMTAALLPTLCAPKIHLQDNTSLSTVGFRSDGNPRILETESIPMLEEMTGSSGDEISPKLLARGSSLQKFNLRPKLSFRSGVKQTKEDGSAQGRPQRSAASKNQSPKTALVKTNESDFCLKPNNGILKHRESFAATKSIHEVKNKNQRRTCFENENFHFAYGNKPKGNLHPVPGLEPLSMDHIFPETAEGKCDHLESDQFVKTKEKDNASKEKNKTLRKLMNEISKDLNEMQILREDKPNKTEEIVEVHESKRNKSGIESKNDVKNKIEVDGRPDAGRKSMAGCRKNSIRKKCNRFKSESEAVNLGPSLSEITKFEETKADEQKFRGTGKGKSLTWKMTAENEEEDEEEEEEEEEGGEKATQERLLPQENSVGRDVILRSELTRMPEVNRRRSAKMDNEDELEKVRKSKVEWVLNITYITAMWGLMLCLSNMGKIYSLFGIPESGKVNPFLNNTYLQSKAPTEENEGGILLSSWPWLWFQTFCRALELAMGCAMANITRQPAANHRYTRTLSFRHGDTFYNI